MTILVGLLACGCQAIARTPTDFGFAAHILQRPAAARSGYVRLIERSHADSVRDDFTWASIEPARGVWKWSGPDTIVRLAAEHHLHVLMLADTAPAWASGSISDFTPPTNPADYGQFTAALAARYGRGGSFWRANPRLPVQLPAGIEVWNEPNLGLFGGGTPIPPATYVAMLKAAYTAVKRITRTLPVITGGLSPAGSYYDDVGCTGSTTTPSTSVVIDGLNYLADMYADGAHGFFDAVAWHGYDFSNASSAAQLLAYGQCSGWSQIAETPISVRSLMVANGDAGKPVWLTEIGAPTCPTPAITPAPYTCVSPADQASFIQTVMAEWAGLSWAGGIYVYDVQDDGDDPADPGDAFGAVSSTGTPKPEYADLRGIWAKWPAPAALRTGSRGR